MNDLETRAFIEDAERVAERVKAMGVDQIVALWNERVADHYRRCIEVHRVNDRDWWGWLANELEPAELVERLLESELNDWFMPNDLYFYYNDEEGLFHSFSDKDDIFDALDLAVFIETLMNE